MIKLLVSNVESVSKHVNLEQSKSVKASSVEEDLSEDRSYEDKWHAG